MLSLSDYRDESYISTTQQVKTGCFFKSLREYDYLITLYVLKLSDFVNGRSDIQISLAFTGSLVLNNYIFFSSSIGQAIFNNHYVCK